MACGATLSLKRHLEFDPLHSPSSRSPKRRRCTPMTISPAVPPTKQHQIISPFAEVTPKLSSEQIAAQLGHELRRMHRRRQLWGQPYPHGSSSPPHTSGTSSPPPPPYSDIYAAQPASPPASSSCSSSSFFNALSPGKKDAPLFTFKQVSLVCERMLKEREEQIREEYDNVLTGKIAEQYEAFLKFNHDQLHRRFQEKPASYVS